MVSQSRGQKQHTKMNQNNKQPEKILLLEAPKASSVSPPITADTAHGDEASDARKYGENTGRDSATGRFTTGNPGKPVGALHFSTMFKRVIRQPGGVTKDGQKVPLDELITKKIATMAAEGNLKAANMVMDRVDGRPRQSVDVTSNGDRVGTVVLSPELDAQVTRLFRRKKPVPKVEEIKQDGNNQSTTKPADGTDNRGGAGIPEDVPQRSAYEKHV